MTVATVPTNTNTAGTGINMAGISDPTAALGAISSQEWSTYMQHFVPYENQLIQYAQDPNLVQKQMDQAVQTVTQATGQSAGIQARQMAQMGTTLTQQQQEAVAKQKGISDVVAKVNAANQAKDTAVANQMGIMGAPMTGITGSV